jgi:hypothetical protein
MGGGHHREGRHVTHAAASAVTARVFLWARLIRRREAEEEAHCDDDEPMKTQNTVKCT